MLPPSLFELKNLERLTIYTADLEEIPKEIGNLTNLTYLSISCCSYDRPVPGQRMIRNDEVALKELPQEIGRLSKLECLIINATGLRKLPPELADLKQLKYLDVSRNMLANIPHDILSRLSRGSYKNFEGIRELTA